MSPRRSFREHHCRHAVRLVIACIAFQPLTSLPEGSSSFPTTLVSDGGSFRLELKPAPSPLPFNELFELHIAVQTQRPLDDSNPLWLNMEAVMPGHGHGMNTHARVEALDGGRFIIRGLLLHMSGEWELSFDIAKGKVHEQAKARFVLD